MRIFALRSSLLVLALLVAAPTYAAQNYDQPRGKPAPRPQVLPAENYGVNTMIAPDRESGREQLREQRRQERLMDRARERLQRDGHNSANGLPSNVQVIRQPQGTAAVDIQSGTVTQQQPQDQAQQQNAEAQAALQQQMQQLGLQQQQIYNRVQQQLGRVPHAYKNAE